MMDTGMQHWLIINDVRSVLVFSIKDELKKMTVRRRTGLVGLVFMLSIMATSASNDLASNGLTLTFTPKADEEAKLPVNSSFVFDGTTSDIARQLYLRHLAGDSIDKVVPNTIPTPVMTRLSSFNISFENLPGLLQRALLWDSGYVMSPQNNAIQIWTLGGRSMATLAVSKVEFDATGCTTVNCTQPDDTTYYANKLCTGTKMLTAAKCMMDDFESAISSYTAMWSDGGDVNMIPEIRALKHGWLDSSTNTSHLLSAVHTMSVDFEPPYGACNIGGYGSLVVPCYPRSNAFADVVAAMSVPIATPWITTWIKQYQPILNAANGQSDKDSDLNLCLLIPIIIAALAVVFFIFFVVVRKRRHLRSVYWQRNSPVEADGRILRQKLGRLRPGAAPCLIDSRTSAPRTKQETIGEFNQTLHLPGESDSPVEEPSPFIEEVLPRPRRHPPPVSRNGVPARGNDSAVQPDPQAARSRTVPIDQSTASGAQTQAVPAHPASRARCESSKTLTPASCQSTARTFTHASRQSRARASTSVVRCPLVHTPSTAMNQASPSSPSTGQRSTEARCKRSSMRSYSHAAQENLPTLQKSISTPAVQDLKPSIRDWVQADHQAVSAMRETFCRYSAADSVQYTLTTDPNLVGKRITWERIELGSLLSRGAYGEVWACRYAGKKVAVKRLLQSKEPTFHATETFTNEIQLTASLNHPNIVRFIGVTWSSLENLAMVIEYLPRGDMQNYLQQNGDLITWARDKIDMAIGVARALAYLHNRMIIHRDIKARNVLLTKRLQPQLIDFGASRLSVTNEMTAGIGTPFWTAPEVLESTEYTEKADIYSFGVLLSELDTCEAPYHNIVGSNGEKMKPFYILTEVVEGSLRPSLSAECPQRIRKVADACLQHDPKLRPSALELIESLGG